MRWIRNLVISKDAPSARNCVWAKPSDTGFSLFLLDETVWKPLVLSDNKGHTYSAESINDLNGYLDDVVESNNLTVSGEWPGGGATGGSPATNPIGG